MRAVCVYLAENRSFYVHALSITGQNAFQDYFASMMKPLIALQLTDAQGGGSEFALDFFADAIVVSVRRWLSHTPVVPPEDYARELCRTVKTISSLEA